MAKKRVRRTKEQIELDNAKQSKGLGDTVEKVFKATGIDKVAKFILGEDCGCDARKEKLNKLFPYRKPLCLTEQEYEYLDNYFSTVKNSVGVSVQMELLKIYNRVLQYDRKPTSCNSCFLEVHKALNKIYKTYKDENKTEN